MSKVTLWLVAVLVAGPLLAQTASKPAAKPPAAKPGTAKNGAAAVPIPPPPPPKVSPEEVQVFVRQRGERRFADLLVTARAMTVAAPTDPVGWGYLGEAQMRMGDWQQAAQALRMAVSLKSNSPADKMNLATALVQVGIRRLRLGYAASDVELLWREAQVLDPENPWPHVCLGDLAMKSGEPKQAEREYLRAVRVDAGCFAAYQGLARVYAMLGDVERARACREAGAALAPPAGQSSLAAEVPAG